MSLKFKVVSLLLYCIPLQRLAVASQCHRDEKFVKVEADGLPEINPIKVVTVTEETFCSIKCVDHQGCKSYAYLHYTTTDNCLLSSNVDGASVSGASGMVVIYKKVMPEVPMGCDPNPCLNGGMCVDTCEEPYFSCTCPEETTGQVCTRILIPFYAKFTNLNGYGRIGPTALGSSYDGQPHKDLTTLQNGIQLFTVPHTGTYTIVAVGAAGGIGITSKSYRAKGAKIMGDFNLEKGQVLKILVGQVGKYNYPYNSAGGGGGTFVVTASNTPLIIAGGGGGTEKATQMFANAHASTGSSGNYNDGGSKSWAGGSNGYGATEADTSNSGGGGGGFYSNGRSGTNFGGSSGFGGEGGFSFLAGGLGGRSYINNGEGGFGGGGGSYGSGGGAGGGGGYSGGASGDNNPNSCGGGGGSYNGAFQNIVKVAAYNGLHGYVEINRIS